MGEGRPLKSDDGVAHAETLACIRGIERRSGTFFIVFGLGTGPDSARAWGSRAGCSRGGAPAASELLPLCQP